MSAIYLLIPALLMILAVVGAGAWNAYQQVHAPSQRLHVRQAPKPVTATRFIVAMVLVVLALLTPLVVLVITFSNRHFAL